MKSMLAYASLMMIFSVGCKKDSIETSIQNSITNRTWKSTGFKLAGVEQPSWCWKNSLFNFYEDGKVFITEGDNGGACFGTVIGRIKKYNYSISSDEKQLIIQYNIGIPDEVDTFFIQSVSEGKLNLQRIVNKTTMPPGESWEDEFSLMP